MAKKISGAIQSILGILILLQSVIALLGNTDVRAIWIAILVAGIAILTNGISEFRDN